VNMCIRSITKAVDMGN